MNALGIFFRMEVKLMFDNCIMYNGAGSVYAREAAALEKFLMPRIDRLCRREDDESAVIKSRRVK